MSSYAATPASRLQGHHEVVLVGNASVSRIAVV